LRPQPLDFGGQTAALDVIEPLLLAQELFENTDFLPQVFNNVLLIAVHPASHADHQKGKRIPRHRMATPPSIRHRPLPLPNLLKNSASVAIFQYLDTPEYFSRLAPGRHHK
jgi:hypothetical protein